MYPLLSFPRTGQSVRQWTLDSSSGTWVSKWIARVIWNWFSSLLGPWIIVMSAYMTYAIPQLDTGGRANDGDENTKHNQRKFRIQLI